MRSDHHAQIISLEEVVKVVGSKCHHVVFFFWVSNRIVLETLLFFSLMRVTPQEIKYFLVVFGLIFTQIDFEWSLNFLYSLNVLNGWTNSTMTTEDPLLLISDHGGKRHLLECFIDFVEHAVWVIDVFAQSFGTLIPKPEILVDIFILMVASKKDHLPGIFQFESKQKANDLQAEVALVDVVS